MRYLGLVIVLLLCGCAQTLPLENYLVLRDQRAFILAFEAYVPDGVIEPLQQFVDSYPDSAWAGRAASVIQVQQRLTRAQLDADERLSQLQLSSQTRVAELFADNVAQEEVINALKEQIEQLKTLLIQMEQHPQ
jgi:hypothetical protein